MQRPPEKSYFGASTTSTHPSYMMGTSGWELFPRSDMYRASSDTSFSSSLPALAHEKLNLNEPKNDHRASLKGKEVIEDGGNHTYASLKGKEVIEDGGNHTYASLKGKEVIEDDGNHTYASLLPDEDELLSEVMYGFEISWLSNLIDDSGECDLFDSGGGLELENDTHENLSAGLSNMSLSNGDIGNGGARFNLSNGLGTVTGEHPLGEHPSRTLFVRNINIGIDDADIRSLFEKYGDIRSMYTACKSRGFVMISYYDIRAARDALRDLQNKPLKRKKLDIHYSIPKDNPSDKEINQGTLVVFNLEPSVSNDELLTIFGAYGEIKEIRETPNRIYHRFVEFYDTRAAEAALRSLNGIELAGMRIHLEPSHPGGTRRSLLLNLSNEVEEEEWRLQQMRSLVENSSPGNFRVSSLPGSSPRPFSGTKFTLGSSDLCAETSATRGQAIMPPFVPSIDDVFPFVNNHASFCSSDKPHQQQRHFLAGSAPSPVQQFGGTYNDQRFVPSNGTNSIGSVSPVFNMMSPRLSPVFPVANFEAYTESRRPRRAAINEFQTNRRMQFHLDLDKITSGEDTRTTLMIKNIPNKYTSKMLLEAIDEHNKGTYDFLYLPIDFKNKCNVGYAFINLLSPSYIIPFYETFNGQKWEKFNSEKIASLAYARIQGKSALVAHFQNSSLMQEDKRCWPIVFNSDPPESSNRIVKSNGSR